MRKTMFGLSPALLLGATLLTATAVQAQSDAPPPPGGDVRWGMRGGLMGVQPDASGNITRPAALAAADQRFAAMDANHDGTVTPDEMRAYREQRRAEHAARRPGADRPGRPAPQPITADAFRARAAAMFDRLDTNHDGKVDPAERAAAPRWGGRHGGGMQGSSQTQPSQSDAD
ncbi:hypothetical protein [uncultured Sphingomonas sp.]|uniref:hypothetical protein n=1 Tax=uncultured Sphingomonas sp. TaxID=158754 RepID=UPI0025DC744D|nr:hypothetical protein [uncultured Sphingomonas sp.]